MAGELPPVVGTLEMDIAAFMASMHEFTAELNAAADSAEESAARVRAAIGGQVDAEELGADKTAAASARMAGEQDAAMDSSGALASKTRSDAEDVGEDLSNMASVGTKADEDLAKAHEDLSGKSSTFASKLSNTFKSAGESLSNWGIPFSGSVTKMGENIDEAETKGKGFSQAMSSIGGIAMTAGVAGVAVFGAASVKAASDFQESMTQLVTGAGESQKNLAMVSSGILNMAGSVGTSAGELAKGMYMIESAGFHGAAGLTVLEATAEGAKVGTAQMSDVANVLTSALNSYHLPASAAVTVTNELVATVAAGKMHMQDLATSISNVLPIAASVHLSFAQVGGALATMTMQGMTARRASMNLANMLTAMVSPSATASAEMKRLGLSANQVANDLGKQGITGTLDELTGAILRNTKGGSVMATGFASMSPAAKALSERILGGSITTDQLTTALKGLNPEQAKMVTNFEAQATSATGMKQTFDSAMKTMTGGLTGLKVSLLLGGDNAKTFAANVHSVATAAKEGGTQVHGFSDVQKDLGFQMDQAKFAIDALAIKFGDLLIPKLEDVIHWTADAVMWFEKHKVVAEALGAAIAGPLVLAMGIFAAKSAIAFGQGLYRDISKAASAISGFAAKMFGLGAANDEALASEETLQASMSRTADAMESSGAAITESLQAINASFRELAGSAAGAGEAMQGDMTETASVADATSADIVAANARIDASNAGVGASGGAAAMGEEAGAASGGVEELTGSLGSLSSIAMPAAIAGLGTLALAAHMNADGFKAAAAAEAPFFAAAKAGATTMPELASKANSVQTSISKASAAFASGKLSLFQYKAVVSGLQTSLQQTDKEQTNYSSGLDTLTGKFGLTSTQAQSLAKAVGVNLDDALSNADVGKVAGELNTLANQAGMSSGALISFANTTHETLTQAASYISSATSGAAQSWSQFSASLNTTTGQTAAQTKTFYKSQETDGTDFVTNIQKAISDGYNPAYIQNLLQQGPQAAGALLQQLVSAQGAGMAALVNQTQANIATQGQRAVTEARITAEGVKYAGTQMGSELSAALALALASTSANAGAETEAVVKKYNLTWPQVESISKAYGGALSASALAEIGTTYSAFGNLGVQASSGFAAGINNGLPLVISQVDHMVSAAVQAGSGHLKAASPSKLTEELWGLTAAQGMAAGLKAGTSQVVAASVQMVQEAALQAQQVARNAFMADVKQLAAKDHESIATASADLQRYFNSGSSSGGVAPATASSAGGAATISVALTVNGAGMNMTELAAAIRRELLQDRSITTLLGRTAGRRI